jgi:hypothetical protein
MEYNDEQRAIIRRMGDVSARVRVAMDADRAAHLAMTHELVNLGAELSGAIRRSGEIHALLAEHGDLFREFLDTL